MKTIYDLVSDCGITYILDNDAVRIVCVLDLATCEARVVSDMTWEEIERWELVVAQLLRKQP